MLRSALLTLSSNEAARQLATRSGLGRRVALRFVAGETLDDALAVAEDLETRGALVELDYLGEHASDWNQAALAVNTYLKMLDRIAEAHLGAHVSVKPSQMGQEIGDDVCLNDLDQVLKRATQYGNFVWIDMEGSDFTERTVNLYEALRPRYENVGIALQAYLYRCKEDVESIISVGGTIRLVKGAYNEPPSAAFPNKGDVDRNFMQLTDLLLSSGHFHAIATHDENMIAHAIEFAREHGIDSQQFEFQLLYGIRRDLQNRLLRDGYCVRIYVPFGEQWYPYLMRRMAERPANLRFFVTNVLTEMRGGGD